VASRLARHCKTWEDKVTYFGVLLWFIGLPTIPLIAATLYDLRSGRRLPACFRTWPPWAVVAGHIVLALLYTTPWDNYLVANRVWRYNPDLVTGITLGWVPIEEYTFFVVQTLASGLWLLIWMRRLPPPAPRPLHHGLRWISLGIGGATWLAWLILLLSGWTRGLYMSLILVWALPPILLQLGFGADILWHYRRQVLAGLVPSFLYMSLVDALGIGGGTWTINPDNVVGVYLGGVLPLEEATFFLVTSVLINLGIVLVLAQESHVRARLRQAPG
jgi:lycopene cyclase domain-containing protein